MENENITLIYLDSICTDPFWNSTLTFNSPWPRLTSCFQHTSLSWPAPVLFLILFLFRVSILITTRHGKQNRFRLTHLFFCRMLGTLFLLGLTVAELARSVVEKDSYYTIIVSKAFIIANVFRLAAFLSAVLLLTLDRRRGHVASGPLFVFWTLLLATDVFKLYLQIMEQMPSRDLQHFIINAILTSLVAIQFLLSFLAEDSVDRRETIFDEAQQQWPQENASYPSLLYFSFMIRLIYKAWRRGLTDEDMYRLPSMCSSVPLKETFFQHWNKIFTEDKSKMDAMLKRPEVPVQSLGNMTPTTTDQVAMGGAGHTSERRLSFFNLASYDATNNNNNNSNNNNNNSNRDNNNGGSSNRASQQKEKRYPQSLITTLLRIHGFRYTYGILQKMVAESLWLLQPLLVRQLINFVQKPTEERTLWVGILLCLGFMFSQMVGSFLYNSSIYVSGLVGLRMKSAILAAIFQKAMTMSAEAGKQFSTGEMITLMSVDSQRVLEVWRIVVLMAGAPIQIVVSVIMLYFTIGLPSVVGVGFLFLLLPLNWHMTSQMRVITGLIMTIKSRRVKLITEVLSGIKVLKLYAWEQSFQEKITDIRKEEIHQLRRLALNRAFLFTNMILSPYMVTLLTFGTFVLTSSDPYLDPATAFVSITYFNILRGPLIMLPFISNAVVMSIVSLKRINVFLYGEDQEAYVHDNPKPGCAISVTKGDFAWDSRGAPILARISMDIREHSLSMLVGKVGSGKSSILSAILGEMRILYGTVDLKGTVAYVAQQAWIQNATLRDNILFGCPYDGKKYRHIIKACALKADLKLLTDGDMTIIGAKGINLSGGQKQRISLARAVYSEKEIYLLDDPLSAVDSHVGKHIFKHVISEEGLLKGKTRLLVTHGAHWLPHSDHVFMVEDGLLTHSGSYDELVSRDSGFVQMLAQQNKEDSDESGDEAEDDYIQMKLDEDDDDDYDDGVLGVDEVDENKLEKSEEINHTAFGMSGDPSAIALRVLQKSLSKDSDYPESEKMDGEDTRGMTEGEKMQTGKVRWMVPYRWMKSRRLVAILSYCPLSIYFAVSCPIDVGWMVPYQWVKSGRLVVMVMSFAFLSIFRATDVTGNFTISFWTSDSLLANVSLRNSTEFQDRNQFYLTIFGSLGLVQVIFFATGMCSYWLSATASSKALHDKMLTSVFRSPMSFFDVTPMGRLLNRFAGDIEMMDSIFPQVVVDILNCMNQLIGTVCVLVVNFPMFIAAALPICGIFYFLQVFFLPVARQIKRMESVSKSPVYSHFGEAVNGASTIRAYGHTQRFMADSAGRVDFSANRTLVNFACIGWLGMCLDLLGMAVTVTTAVFVVFSTFSDGAIAGLTVSYAMEVSLFLNYMVIQQAEFTANAVAVERILEYSKLPSEAERYVEKAEVNSQWPREGQIEFKDVQLRYRPDLDLVLKGISTVVNPGEKVGIVGRTGAGKSSLSMALFRLVELAGGSILLDGVDIATIGLYQLRSKISILPQDPVLFSGSLRMNLDPHDEFKDEQVKQAMSRAHLGELVTSSSRGLNYDVGEEGRNLSVGQRQLVCLARALLRQSRVLLLDEATAAVDIETDSFIQDTIRTSFKDCTVLAIAHRINTIMDYDRIMVLDAGRIAEMGSPSQLLSDADGIFYSLALESNLVR